VREKRWARVCVLGLGTGAATWKGFARVVGEIWCSGGGKGARFICGGRVVWSFM